MFTFWKYVFTGLLLFAFASLVYLKCNKGMARNARGQQLRRLFVAAVVAMLPIGIGGIPLSSASFLLPLAVGVVWMVTYPLLYHLTYRRSSPDYENYMDITFGLYLIGWLASVYELIGLIAPGNGGLMAIMTLLEFCLCVIPLFQWTYYIAYKTCVDANGIQIVQETNVNEIIEFFHSFPFWATLAVVASLTFLAGAIGVVNFGAVTANANVAFGQQVVSAALVLTGVYIWKRHHGVFVRTGMLTLFQTVKNYIASNKNYQQNQQKRLASLQVEPVHRTERHPSTIIMVIGESACRDFMSAYHMGMKEDTTPWMRQMAGSDPRFLLFPNAYSCAMQTVPALERALTERNQYNRKPFYESCSVIDIAHQLGYKVHWFSNQGHLGAAETPVTLIADTADVAHWTRQEVNKVQYDAALLDFYEEIDPSEDNFIVFHLKGSHFNFQNRYPREFTRWGNPDVQDNVVNYKNSIAYTDSILQRIFDYARRHLHLQAFVYFSDHATEPGRRRKPNFDGFQMVRIPLAVWYSEEYAEAHGERFRALQTNKERYFTNDLVYELMCGVFDVVSNHFDTSASLAYADYRYRREDLLTYEGKKPICLDSDVVEP